MKGKSLNRKKFLGDEISVSHQEDNIQESEVSGKKGNIRSPSSKCLNQRILSSKNLHQMKKFGFPLGASMKIKNKQKQDRIAKLNKQKENLLQSLQYLKNGAVSAIIEKDEAIEKLKKVYERKIKPENDQQSQSQIDEAQDFESLVSYIKDLQDDRDYFRKELQLAQKLFEEQIIQKDQIIYDLSEELDISARRIDNLEKYGELLYEKVKVVEANNQNLSIMLSNSQISNREEEKANQSAKSKEQLENSHSNSHSQFQLFVSKSSKSNCEIMESADESSIMENRLKEMKREYEVEIDQLTTFYKNQIETLKKICEKEYSQTPKINTYDTYEGYLLDNQSNNSSMTQKLRDNQRIQKLLNRNYSIGSLNSRMKMETIYEKDQAIGISRNLKKDIFDFEKQSNSSQNIKTIEKQKQEEEQSNQNYVYPYTQIQLSKQKEAKSQRFKIRNIFWFAIGALTGGTVISLTQKIFK